MEHSENFKAVLEEKTRETESIIAAYLPKEEGFAKELAKAMNYSMTAGGKRLRPLLLQESFCLFGGTGEAVKPFMAAMEMIHTYSLVHDDLPAMDNDAYRRGRKTTHIMYGEAMGILAGDGLLNYAFETAIKAFTVDPDNRHIPAALKILAEKAGIYGMVGGQSLDVWLTDKPMNEAQLEFIFNLKTGALIEAAFMAGAILAGADDRTVEKMEKAGNLIGVAFQIQDDILDVTSTQEVLGKPVLSDEKNHKTTYVTLYGMEKAEKDVVEMSNEALRLIEETGENEFLDELVRRLIHREK